MGTIKAGRFLGNFITGPGTSLPVYAVSFTDGGALLPANEYNGGYVPRTRNFVLSTNSYFQAASDFNDTLAAEFPATPDGGTGFDPPVGWTTPNGWVKLYDDQGKAYYKQISGSTPVDSNGDGLADTTTVVRSANVLTQITDWVKANPVWAIAIVVAVIYVYNQSQAKGRGKRKKLLGIL